MPEFSDWKFLLSDTLNLLKQINKKNEELIKKSTEFAEYQEAGKVAFKLNEHLPELFKRDNFLIEFEKGILEQECKSIFLKGEPTKKMIDEGLINKEHLK